MSNQTPGLTAEPLEDRTVPARAGDLDPSFGGFPDAGGRPGEVITAVAKPPPASGRALSTGLAVARQPDGRIVVAGTVSFDQWRDFGLARYEPDGELDRTFGTGGVAVTSIRDLDDATAVGVRPDGRIVAAGTAQVYDSGDLVLAMACYNPDGTLYAGFGTGGVATYGPGAGPADLGTRGAAGLVVLPDGRMLVGLVGRGEAGEGVGVARFHPDGSVDRTFGVNGVGRVAAHSQYGQGLQTIALQPDGRIVGVGTANFDPQSSGSYTNNNFFTVRLTADGHPDPTFGPGSTETEGTGGWVIQDWGGPYDRATAVAVQPDGRIVVAGVTGESGAPAFGETISLIRYRPAGTPDPTFGSGGKVRTSIGNNDSVSSVLVQPDGKLVVVGATGSNGSPTFAAAVVRYNPDGSADATFGTGGVSRLNVRGDDFSDGAGGGVLLPDGQILVAGGSSVPYSYPDFYMARVLGKPRVELQVTEVKWNENRGPNVPQLERGFDFTYERDGEFDTPPKVMFFWATGETLDTKIGGPVRPSQLLPEDKTKRVNEPAIDFGRPPPGTQYLLVALDPENQIAEADETNNVKALPLHTKAEILNAAVTAFPVGGTKIAGSFVPGRGLLVSGGQPLTLSEAEVVFGVDHFNWVQTVTPPVNVQLQTWRGIPSEGPDGHLILGTNGNPTGVQRVQDSSAGYDPVVNLTGDYVYLKRVIKPSGDVYYVRVHTPEQPDAYPPYLSEVPANYATYVRDEHGGSNGGTLGHTEFAFGDEPSTGREEFLSENSVYRMATRLVGVGQDHQVQELDGGIKGFTWEWNSSTIRNINFFGGRPANAPSIEGGGIFNVRYDDGTPAPGFPTDPPPLPPFPEPPPALPPTVPPPPGVPPIVSVGPRQFAVGVGTGSGAVTLYDPDKTGRFTVSPFGTFTGGARTAAGDFNADGVADLVAGTGPGVATRVRILDGKTQAELFAVDPFETAFTRGVYVAAGDFTGDGVPELVITPDEGGGPRVRIFNGSRFGLVADFFGIEDVNFRGGARAAVGDINGDGTGDLVVAAGFQGGPRVAGFSGRSLSTGPVKLFGDFFAFEQTLRNGVFVTAGDLDGDGFAELIAGGGPGGGPRVTAFSGKALLSNQQAAVANFFGGHESNRGGIRLAVKDLDGDTRADLVVGAGEGAGSRVTAYYGKTVSLVGTPPAAFDFDAIPGFAGGVFVG